jgi:hypothetical protein
MSLHENVAATAGFPEMTSRAAERDEARTQLREAESTIAALREQVAGAGRKALTECADDADASFSGDGIRIRAWRDAHYPAPVEAAPQAAVPRVVGDIARATERMTRIAQISRKLAEVSQLPDDYTAAEDFECAEAALLTLATGGGR